MSDEWKRSTLGELFEIGAGKTMSAAARNGEAKIPFLRTSNVFWDRLDLSTLDEMAIPARELPDKLIQPGDLLVCEGGEIGRAAIWDGSVAPMAFQNHLHRLRPRVDDVEPRFFVYYLQSAFTQLGIFAGAGNKTTIPNLSSSRLAALEVPRPPLDVQRAVVHVLSTIREGITVQQRAIATAMELKRATTAEIFSRGLTGGAVKDSDVGPVPESWAVVPLGSLGRIGNGSTPKRSNASYWSDGTFPWLTSAKVYDRNIRLAEQFVTDVALDECHLPRVHPGAVLMAITGQGKTLGHVAVLDIEATVNQHIAYIQTDIDRADPSFIRGYLETQYDALRRVASGGGSTKGALTCAFLRGLPVPLPELSHQREIVTVLDALDQKVSLHRDKLSMLEELFSSLLQAAMTERITTHDLVVPAAPVEGSAA